MDWGYRTILQIWTEKNWSYTQGFYTYEKSVFRNPPQWQIPIELKRRIPEIPLFCDPSHICGNTELLLEVSQKAIDLDYQGLMIESRILIKN